ncbi:hypothetical protein NDU88_001432 [Pleurodeles waltl]|uniref:Uncharacterized protein n=1 Tax=Pleurodeles waltl TaxID=8319 RepID=A0AAV7R741_PLEWA|nr:hypothetical protein NDU88_001432 [Pleurodeles waltl]
MLCPNWALPRECPRLPTDPSAPFCVNMVPSWLGLSPALTAPRRQLSASREQAPTNLYVAVISDCCMPQPPARYLGLYAAPTLTPVCAASRLSAPAPQASPQSVPLAFHEA